MFPLAAPARVGNSYRPRLLSYFGTLSGDVTSKTSGTSTVNANGRLSNVLYVLTKELDVGLTNERQIDCINARGDRFAYRLPSGSE
jgi:hypothetical protein